MFYNWCLSLLFLRFLASQVIKKTQKQINRGGINHVKIGCMQDNRHMDEASKIRDTYAIWNILFIVLTALLFFGNGFGETPYIEEFTFFPISQPLCSSWWVFAQLLGFLSCVQTLGSLFLGIESWVEVSTITITINTKKSSTILAHWFIQFGWMTHFFNHIKRCSRITASWWVGVHLQV